MFRYARGVLFLLFSFLSHQASANPEIVTIAPLSPNDARYTYANELLNRILEKTKKQHMDEKIVFYREAVSRQRAFRLLKEGKINIMAEATQKHWEKELIPIRIPIRKGIQGYRLFMVHKEHAQTVAQSQTLDDIRQFSTGAGFQWAIRRILEQNDFEVITSQQYDSLFKMLNAERFITFSRGVNEIFSEYQTQRDTNPNIIIDNSVALYTPLPTFYFVSPNNQALADRIQTGLNMMIKTGEFDQFFYTNHRTMLERANLEQRKTFTLSNANLSLETQDIITRRYYWHFPGDNLQGDTKAAP